MGTLKRDFIWANLMHLGVDMWIDHPYGKYYDPHDTLQMAGPSPDLQCDEGEWRAITDRMAAVGMNMLVIDLAEGLRYPSHPELAVNGSWTPDRMRDEIGRLSKMGIEAVPKVNFSAGHDSWFKHYGRMLSTSEYYQFCSDIIRDVAEIFRGARFFHIGMDEESWINQVECYLKLEEAGFDQIPCAGNWREDCNFSETVRFCGEHLSPERFKGMLLAPWRRILPMFHEANVHGVELAGAEIQRNRMK